MHRGGKAGRAFAQARAPNPAIPQVVGRGFLAGEGSSGRATLTENLGDATSLAVASILATTMPSSASSSPTCKTEVHLFYAYEFICAYETCKTKREARPGAKHGGGEGAQSAEELGSAPSRLLVHGGQRLAVAAPRRVELDQRVFPAKHDRVEGGGHDHLGGRRR